LVYDRSRANAAGLPVERIICSEARHIDAILPGCSSFPPVISGESSLRRTSPDPRAVKGGAQGQNVVEWTLA
jgi:hypothetical protein